LSFVAIIHIIKYSLTSALNTLTECNTTIKRNTAIPLKDGIFKYFFGLNSGYED
jgi:hypothetical protein